MSQDKSIVGLGASVAAAESGDNSYQLKSNPLDELLSFASRGFKQPPIESATDDELDRSTGDEISELVDKIADLTKNGTESCKYVIPTSKFFTFHPSDSCDTKPLIPHTEEHKYMKIDSNPEVSTGRDIITSRAENEDLRDSQNEPSLSYENQSTPIVQNPNIYKNRFENDENDSKSDTTVEDVKSNETKVIPSLKELFNDGCKKSDSSDNSSSADAEILCEVNSENLRSTNHPPTPIDLQNISESTFIDEIDSEDEVDRVIQNSLRNFTTDRNDTSNSHILPLSSIFEDETGEEAFISAQIELGRESLVRIEIQEASEVKGSGIEQIESIKSHTNEAVNENITPIEEDSQSIVGNKIESTNETLSEVGIKSTEEGSTESKENEEIADLTKSTENEAMTLITESIKSEVESKVAEVKETPLEVVAQSMESVSKASKPVEPIDDSYPLSNPPIISMEDFAETTVILNDDQSLVNPVHEDLKLEPIIKELRISRKYNLNPSLPPEEKKESIYKSSSWLKFDEEHLFEKIDEQEAERLSKLLIEDEEQEPINQKQIYLASSISSPVMLLKRYLKEPKIQRSLYLNFKLNSALAIKHYLETLNFLSSAESKLLNLKGIQIKLFTSEQSAKFAFAKLHSIGLLYDKIKVLGLFQLEYSKSNFDFANIEIASTNFKLPCNTEKLVIANGFNLDEGLFLPVTLKFAAFYCSLINLSKFNVTKNLQKLHVQSLDKELKIIKFGRTEKYPVGFSGLKEVKFSSKILLYPNLDTISNLHSLTLSDLDFKTTRNLRFPPMLRCLVFENCLISLLVTFPQTLRRLVVRGGKWKEQRIITYVKLRELVLERTDISDIVKKVNKPRELTSLTINQCQLQSLDDMKFAETLRHIDISNNNITKISKVKFPSGLKSLKLNNNYLQSWDSETISETLGELNLSSNNLVGHIILASEESNLKIINVANNPQLKSIQVGKNVEIIDLSGTQVDLKELKTYIQGEWLQELVLNNCNIPEIILSVPSNIAKLEMRNCQVNVLELEFAVGSKLQHLDLSYNNLSELNNLSFENCLNLKEINLAHNQIEQFNLFSQPLRLDLSHNKLKTFSTNFPLKFLNLSDNKFDSIDSLSLPETLETLYLNENMFATISHDFHWPKNLQFLSLQQCHISTLDVLIPSKLEVLRLKNNRLHSKSFGLKCNSPTVLNLLDLSENFFKDFNFNTIQDIELAQLNLANNMFDDIPLNIPSNILCAIFNSSSDSVVHNLKT